MDNPVKEMLEGAIKNIDTLIDTRKVIGEPINAADGTIIVPVSKVSLGFGGGGSEFGKDEKHEGKSFFGGGMGGGIKMDPEAFLVINNGNVRLITMDGGSSPLDKVIDLVPGMVDKVNGFFSKGKTEKE